mmetsp:Transcript_60470/g.129719  ORF Transcript_60470/g.129719 Transcript_60470/m.129719 type:complete len:237 (+) Transcript_60470:413-1123(+)
MALPGAAAAQRVSIAVSGSSAEAPKTPATCSLASLLRKRLTHASRSEGGEQTRRSTALSPPARASAVVARRNALASFRHPLLPAAALRGLSVDSRCAMPTAAAPRARSQALSASRAEGSARSSASKGAGGAASLPAGPPPRASRLRCRMPAACKASGNSRASCPQTRPSCSMLGEASMRTCNARVASGKGQSKGSSMRPSASAISRSSLAAMSQARASGSSWRMLFIRRSIRRRFS